MTSLPVEPAGNSPSSTTCTVRGICHQNSPVAQMAAASVRTTGVPTAAERAVHVRVRIGRNHKAAGRDVATLHHDLVADARACRVEVDVVLARERLDLAIFFLVGLVFILNIVVEREDWLLAIEHLLRADRLELLHDRGGVVVSHDMRRADGDEIARTQWPVRPFGEVSLRDFFDDGLGHGDAPLALSYWPLAFSFRSYGLSLPQFDEFGKKLGMTTTKPKAKGQQPRAEYKSYAETASWRGTASFALVNFISSFTEFN